MSVPQAAEAALLIPFWWQSLFARWTHRLVIVAVVVLGFPLAGRARAAEPRETATAVAMVARSKCRHFTARGQIQLEQGTSNREAGDLAGPSRKALWEYCLGPLEPVLNAPPFPHKSDASRQHSRGLGRDSEPQLRRSGESRHQLGLIKACAECRPIALGGMRRPQTSASPLRMGGAKLSPPYKVASSAMGPAADRWRRPVSHGHWLVS